MRTTFKMCAVLMLIFAMSVTQFVNAQTKKAAKELRKDKQELKADKKAVADDRQDLDRLSDLVIRWDKLRKEKPNTPAVEALEKRINAELRRDLKESRMEVIQSKGEVKKSAGEEKKSEKKVTREKTDKDRDHRALVAKKKELKTDRTNLKDDVRDSKQAEEILTQKQDIAKKLIALQKEKDNTGSVGDKVLQNKQQKLFEEYLDLSKKEINLGIRELAEDREEQKEDRRELFKKKAPKTIRK